MPAALAIRSLEKDATPAASLEIVCSGCDPDNPRSVPRKNCRRCRGSGRVRAELGEIVAELRASRLELLRSDDRRQDDRDPDLDD